MLKLKKKLPLKLSALARIAARDMRKAIRAGVAHGTCEWIKVKRGRCYVSMAGAVILNRIENGAITGPRMFDACTQNALYAIVGLSRGSPTLAAMYLNEVFDADAAIDMNAAMKHECIFRHANACTKDEALALCNEMDALAERLEADGL